MSTAAITVTLDAALRAELDEEVADGNRSAFVAEALRETLDRRHVAAAARWHASLAGDDAATLSAFDATW